MIDGGKCSRIVFAETSNFDCSVNAPSGLSQARIALARIILETDYGEGYSPATELTVADIATPAMMQAWQDSNAAVNQALSDCQQNLPPPVQGKASISFINNEDPRVVPALLKLYDWLARAPEPVKFGPFMTRGSAAPSYLWLFPGQKGVASGRYPRSDDTPVSGPPVEQAPARSRFFWIVAGAGFILLIVFLAACGYSIITEASAALAKGPKSNPSDLTAQWLFSTGIITSMLLLISYAIRGDAFGFLVDERNRMSLSRLQLGTWTILLIGGYWTLAFWDVRCGANEGIMGAFPTMQQDLWLLLGIVNVSAIASPLILQTKANAATPPTNTSPPQVAPSQVSEIGALDARATISGASWIDLFTGEEVANRGTIDISRVQYFIITLLLLGTYAYILGATMSGLSVSDSGKFLATNMPAVNSTFLGLLAISHSGYLAAKIIPKTT